MPFSLQNLFLATIMLISRKPVQRRGIGENAVFSLLNGRHKKVKLENNGCIGRVCGSQNFIRLLRVVFSSQQRLNRPAVNAVQ